MSFKAFIASSAVAANVVATTAYASCAITPSTSDTLVRGRVVRCEDARFYLEASDAYGIHERDLQAALARVGQENRAALLERLGDGLLTREYQARVIVIAIDWRVAIAPWLPGSSVNVEFKDKPLELKETMRYWWNGPIGLCDGYAEATSLDLWIHHPCCDVTEFASGICIVGMDFAEPMPNVVDKDFSKLLAGR